VLGKGELLVEIVIPTPPSPSGAAYLRFIPREEMDIAIAGVGAFVQLHTDRSRCEQARLTLAAVAPTPIRAREAETFLVGKPLDQATIEQAGELAAKAAKPISDVRGSAAYRVEMIKVLTRRTLQKALERMS
jgi:carbon-monoxide dehydrogenase medium subunit